MNRWRLNEHVEQSKFSSIGFPDAYTKVAAKVHVHQCSLCIRYFKAVCLSNHSVPARSKLFAEVVGHHAGTSLIIPHGRWLVPSSELLARQGADVLHLSQLIFIRNISVFDDTVVKPSCFFFSTLVLSHDHRKL